MTAEEARWLLGTLLLDCLRLPLQDGGVTLIAEHHTGQLNRSTALMRRASYRTTLAEQGSQCRTWP